MSSDKPRPYSESSFPIMSATPLVTSPIPLQKTHSTEDTSSPSDDINKQPEEKPKGESTISVIAAIVGNILVGIVKFIAAAISGSAAMVSEGIHSIVDSGNGALVLYGIHASKKKPDLEHPFGYGKTVTLFALFLVDCR